MVLAKSAGVLGSKHRALDYGSAASESVDTQCSHLKPIKCRQLINELTDTLEKGIKQNEKCADSVS